jgi:hypothetical protein
MIDALDEKTYMIAQTCIVDYADATGDEMRAKTAMKRQHA